MKFSTAAALAMAPLSMAARFRNSAPADAAKRDTSLAPRDLLLSKGMKGHGITAHATTEIIIIWANPGGGAETTTVNEKVTVTETVVAGGEATPPAAAASHTVTVGGPGGLIFQPDQLNNVPIGDTVVFEFLSQNHTVTQSPFDTPCDALDGGMDSGFMPNPDNTVSPAPQVAMQVMVDTPLWFYCKQMGHCGKGMVFSINPTAEKTQAMFQQMAIAQKGDGSATPITGGDGGSAESPAAPPAETPAETPAAPPAEAPAEAPAETPAETPAAGGDAMTPGTGTLLGDGSCSCVVACAAGSFPALDAQGLGAFGGVAGALPAKMAAMR